MTHGELARLLDALDLRNAHVVVHAALPSFGGVEGGAEAVCLALIEAVGDNGTILMPAFTYAETLSASPAGNSTGNAANRHQGRTVAYHPDLPVSEELGPIAETFRHLPGVMRSNHPTHSFCAWGRQAREVLSTQRDSNPLGPIKKLNVIQGQLLLLGASLQSAVAIHLAEERLGPAYLTRRTAVRINAAGYDERVVLENVPGCSAAFVRLEPYMDPTKIRTLPMPGGSARKIPIRYLVQLATTVLDKNPDLFICDDPECPSCAIKRDAIAAPRYA